MELLCSKDVAMCKQEDIQGLFTQTSHPKPRPGRRRQYGYPVPFSWINILLVAFLALSILCVPTAAGRQQGIRMRKPELVERIGVTLVDPRPAPGPELLRRADASSIAAPIISKTITNDVSTSILSAPSDTNTPLPKPFDGGIGTNFTQPSCPTFIKSMISNATFTSCLPFSLLLQNSMSFFASTRTLSGITQTLNASCNVVYPECSAIMSSYALQLRSSSACAQDYQLQNPIIRQAYAGLISYDVLYHASCLRNTPIATAAGQNNSNYCFANAITNATSPTDSYIYYLPLGLPLPPGTLPTCDECLKNTMALFATEGANKSQPLSLDYVNAATMVNEDCGPNFVNSSIPAGASGTGAATATVPQNLFICVGATTFIAGLLQLWACL